MIDYAFSIFVRVFLALSGLLVFIATAMLFGAEGRGLIGYGIALFGSIGLLLSFNLGRVFLSESIKHPEEKNALFLQCLYLNLIATIATIICGLIFWLLSESAREVLTLGQAIAFSILSFWHIWTYNGYLFYSSFLRTKTQDTLIFTTRFVVIFFLALMILLQERNIDAFIWGYTSILSIGSVVEIWVLKKISKSEVFFSWKLKDLTQIIREIFWPHADYIAFNTFSLLLMVMSASYLSIESMGRVNFAVQIINMVFLLSTTANLRVSSYVASGGIQTRMKKFNLLLWFTIFASIFGALAIYPILNFLPRLSMFSSFEGLSKLFVISVFAIPGFTIYQLMTPIWIEKGKLKVTAKWELINLGLCLAAAPFILRSYGAEGFMALFSIFHVNVLIIQLGMYCKYIRKFD